MTVQREEMGRREMTMEFHEHANLFPMIEGKEFVELVLDIRKHGLRQPIWLYEGKILDGRNRWRACQQAGVEPRFEELPPDQDALAFVVSANLQRRHLTTNQRAAIGAKLATMKRGTRTDLAPNDARSELSDAQAAKLMNVSERSVERAKKRMRTDPAAHERALRGKTTRKASKPKTADGDRDLTKPKRSLLVAMGEVGSFTPRSAKRYMAEHPDEAKRIADAASVVAGVAAAVGGRLQGPPDELIVAQWLARTPLHELVRMLCEFVEPERFEALWRAMAAGSTSFTDAELMAIETPPEPPQERAEPAVAPEATQAPVVAVPPPAAEQSGNATDPDHDRKVERIRAEIDRRGSQQKLADATGYSQGGISKAASGKISDDFWAKFEEIEGKPL